MNDALKIENNDIMNKFQKTENILMMFQIS